MKKNLLISSVIVLIILLLGLTGCGKSNESNTGSTSDIDSIKNNVTLSIKKGTLTNTGVTLILKNGSSVDVSYGEPYEIEVKRDGSWNKIDVELNFTMPSYDLNSSESEEIELNWEKSYGKLASGEYRIIKDIDVLKEDGTYESFDVTVEFTIE